MSEWLKFLLTGGIPTGIMALIILFFEHKNKKKIETLKQEHRKEIELLKSDGKLKIE